MWRPLQRSSMLHKLSSVRIKDLAAEAFLLLIILVLLVQTMTPAAIEIMAGETDSHRTSLGGKSIAADDRELAGDPPSNDRPTLEKRSLDHSETVELSETPRALAAAIPRSEGASSDRTASDMGSSQAFLPLDFDLNSASGDDATVSTASAIKIRKTIRAAGQSLGSLQITIDRNSRLFVDAGELRRILTERRAYGSELEYIPESGLIGLTTLRDLGVDMRYNATEDYLALN